MDRFEWYNRNKFGFTYPAFAIPEQCYEFQKRFDSGVIYHFNFKSNGSYINLELKDRNTFLVSKVDFTHEKNTYNYEFSDVSFICTIYNNLVKESNESYYNLCKERFFIGINNSSGKIYLDDIRNPIDPDFVVLRTPQEFKEFIIMMGCPKYISFDHDLGNNVESGYDCLKWLIEYDLENNKTFIPEEFEINVHSANPVGKENILGLWECYIKNKKESKCV